MEQALLLEQEQQLVAEELPVVAAAQLPSGSKACELTTTEMIIMAAQDPHTDAAKIRELYNIKRDIEADEARATFYRAMRDCQAEMKPIVRKAVNEQTHSKYAKLEQIDKVIKPVYQKYGFAIMWNSPMMEGDGKKVNVSCKVIHTSGHAEPFTLPGPLDLTGMKGTPNKTEMHALGSSLSYLKRYLKMFIFDLQVTDEDDDAQSLEWITEEQYLTIMTMLADCGYKPGTQEMAGFLLFASADEVKHIHKVNYEKVIMGLRQKSAKVVRR
jgi:hypothetical protein